MTCGEWASLLKDRALGDLPPDQGPGVAAHLTECASCRAEEEHLRPLVQDLDGLGTYRDVSPSAGFVDRLQGARRSPTRRRRYVAARGSWGRWALAAGAAAAVIFAVRWSVNVDPEEEIAPEQPAPRAARIDRPPDPIPVPPSQPFPTQPDRPPAPPPRPVPEPSPKVEPPRPAPAPPPSPRPEPPPLPKAKPAPAPTIVKRFVATIREASGRFRLGARSIRTALNDLTVPEPVELRADSITKLVLADDRVVLLNARSRATLSSGRDRLEIRLDSGDLLAELVGPGPDVRVVTRAFTVDHVGTVFAVSARRARTTVAVEEGRVDCIGARGTTSVSAGLQLEGTEGRALTGTKPVDPRRFAWAKDDREIAGIRYQEEFGAGGAWEADVADGTAGSTAGRMNLFTSGRPQFVVPERGRVNVVYRATKAGPLVVQLHALQPTMNFKIAVEVEASPEWRSMTFDFAEFTSADLSDKTSRLSAGRPVDGVMILFGGGSIRVDSITVVETKREER